MEIKHTKPRNSRVDRTKFIMNASGNANYVRIRDETDSGDSRNNKIKNDSKMSLCLFVACALAIGMFAARCRSSRRRDLDHQNAKAHNVLLFGRDGE